MSEVTEILRGGDRPILIIGDHASRHVPGDIDLGIVPELLDNHIAVDIGVREVAALLVERLSCSAILCGVSRLVIDCNRDDDAPGLIPLVGDGHMIPGNLGVDRQTRLDRFYHPYHSAIARMIAQVGDPFILSLHSFTPALASDPDQARPWEIGVLYNEDDRGARVAIPLLQAAGLHVGDQLPYSGRDLNYTMNRHVEAARIPYLGVEMRQDISGTRAGQERYAGILASVVEQCRSALA